jgi:hypothetical protein
MIFMVNRLFKVAGLAALVAYPAHGQNLSILDPAAFDHAVAITTYLQVITEDDVDQRTRLDLLLAQRQVGRKDVIGQLGIDMDNIARARERVCYRMLSSTTPSPTCARDEVSRRQI